MLGVRKKTRDQTKTPGDQARGFTHQENHDHCTAIVSQRRYLGPENRTCQTNLARMTWSSPDKSLPISKSAKNGALSAERMGFTVLGRVRFYAG